MIEYYLRNHTVSRDFRDSILDRYPALESSEELRGIFAHFAFGTWRDRNDGYLLIPRSLVAKLVGKERDEKNNKFAAAPWLRRFSTEVIEIQYLESMIRDGRRVARRVSHVAWPDDIKALIDEERKGRADDPIYFVSGGIPRKDAATTERLSILHDAEARISQLSDAGYPEAHRVLSYLNGLSSNRFKKILKHLDKAREIAETTGPAARQNLNTLKAIEEQSKPFYFPSKTNTRVFSLNDSFLRLSREVRKCLTQGWISLDLKSAQLAIVSSEKLWDVPSIRKYLDSGKSIWRDLCGHMDVPYSDEAKAALKIALYSVIFGGGEKRIGKELKLAFPKIKRVFKRFASHEVIYELLTARDRVMQKIEEDGYVLDAFGNRIEIDYYEERLKYPPYKPKSNVRSLMACQAQSYELAILLPIYELAETSGERNGFSILMHLHDGICIETHHKRDRERWTRELCEAVKARADLLEISSELELA